VWDLSEALKEYVVPNFGYKARDISVWASGSFNRSELSFVSLCPGSTGISLHTAVCSTVEFRKREVLPARSRHMYLKGFNYTYYVTRKVWTIVNSNTELLILQNGNMKRCRP